jgi:hypothetical protein
MHCQFRSLCCAAAILAGVAASRLLGQEAGQDAMSPTAAPNLHFRRVLVPEDRIPEFAGRGFFPMVRRDFEHLAELLQREAEFPREAKGAAVRFSHYYGALIDGEFLRGNAALELERRRPGVAAVSLAPLNLAISSPYWKETQTPAAAGSDSTGQFVVLVRRERLLAFNWSAGGTPDPFGAVEFSLSFPESPVRQLTIDLPQELQLDLRGGLMEQIGADVAGDDSALKLAPPDPGMRRWRVDIVGSGPISLRVTPRTAGAESSVVALQQSSIYDLASEGVTLAGELRLFVRGAPLRELVLRGPDDLRLTAARLNDRAVVFEQSVDDPERVVLRFPEPIVGDRHLVRLAARAPLALDRPWRLPAWEVQDVAWRSGQVHLRVAGSLVLSQLAPRECVHVHTAPLASEEAGQSLTFRNYTPQAELTLVASRRPARVQAAGGSSLEFGRASAAAAVVFHVEALQGERFLIAGDVAPDWIIDSAAVSWAKGDPGEFGPPRELVPALENAGREFVLRLPEPLGAGQALRLTFKAHRRLSGDGPTLARQDLRVIELRDVEETARYVAASPEDPYQVVLSGDRDLRRLDPRDLPAAVASLVTTASSGVVFEDTGLAPAVRAQLLSATPSLSARVGVEVHAGGDRLQEKYRIRVAPVSSRIDRLHVHLSQRREQPLAWRWEESPEQALSARRLESEPAEEGETWELTFDRPRDAVFTLTAERAVERSGPVRLSLPSLPQANVQEGELAVRVAAGSAIDLRTDGMKSAPSPPAPRDKYSTVYGTYLFDPAQQPAATVEALHDPVREPGVLAWRCRVTSRYAADGPSQHTAEYQLENAGRDSVLVSLPLGALLRRVEVNGGETPLTVAALRSNATPILLPEGVRFPRLKIEYVTAARPLRWRGDVAMPAPLLDAPVVAREWVVLTAPTLAAAALDDGLALRREDPPWDQRLFGVLRPGGPSRLSVSVHGGEGPLEEESLPRGWTVHRADVSAAGTPQLVLYRRDAVASVAAALFVLATLVLVWLSASRAAWLWIAAALAGAAALLAPAPAHLLGTAIFLSIPAAAILRLATTRPQGAPPATIAESSLSTASFPAALLLAVFSLAALWVGPVVYAQPELNGGRSFRPVVIPVDEQGRFSRRDKYVYLPESLYQGLRQAASRLDAEPHGWLLKSADYQAVFAWGEAVGSIEFQRITAELEFDVIAAPAAIELPSAWGNAGLREDSARLDSEPIPLRREGSDRLAFTADRTGMVRLSLDFKPRVALDGKQKRVELPLFPTADASLKVRYPGRIDAVQMPGVLGSVARDGRSGELSADLGPGDRLVLVWPQAEERSPPARPPHVEQYAWLQVQPDAVVLDAKWKFLGNGDLIDEIEILADDNLTPLPSTAPGLAGFTQVRREGRQSLRLQFDQARVSPLEFQISFLVQGGVGVGRPAAPSLDIQNVVVARRRFAVSIDPSLEVRDVQVAGGEPLPAAQFRSEWGSSAPAPQSAYRVLGETFSWVAGTQVRDDPASGAAECDLIFRRAEVQASYQANLEFGKGQRLTLRLAAPKSLRVERLSVIESGLDRVEHWSQDEDGGILVFLNGRVAGPCRVEIAARAPAPVRGTMELPQIALQENESVTTTYSLHRAPEVAVRVASSEGLSPDEGAPLGRYTATRGRLEAVLVRDAASAAPVRATVEIFPNRPRIARRQLVTLLKPGLSQWSVELDLQLQISQGVVDVLRFDLPSEVSGPFEVQPSARWETRNVGQAGRRVLIVRPDAPLTEAVRLRVTGFLHQGAGDALRAPAIEPLDLGEMPQFLVLPRQWQSQSLTWEVSGMRADPVPSDLRPDNAATISYRVVNKPHYGAVLRRTEHAVGDPRVQLLDVEALLQSQSSYFACASFLFDPAGLSECLFELPEGARLIHADVDGRAVSPTPATGRGYVFHLERARLPVRLAISYAGQAVADNGQTALAAPQLLGAPVERTLWTVWSAVPELSVAFPDRQFSRERQDLLRREALAAVLESPAAVEAEYSQATLAQWRLPWMRRWLEIHLRLSPPGAVAEEAEESAQSFFQRYGLESQLLPTRQEIQRADVVRWPHQTPATRAVFDGAETSVAVRVSANPAAPTPERLAGALAGLFFACAAAWGFRRAHEAEWLARFGPLVLAAAGMAWWVWLTPSLIGLVVVAAGIWLSLGGPLRRAFPSTRPSANLHFRR